jgi:hypothetical protein
MARIHPHAGASYRIIRRPDMTFGTEVTIEGMSPTIITGFATEAMAEAWIEKHRREIEDFPSERRGRPKRRR